MGRWVPQFPRSSLGHIRYSIDILALVLARQTAAWTLTLHQVTLHSWAVIVVLNITLQAVFNFLATSFGPTDKCACYRYTGIAFISYLFCLILLFTFACLFTFILSPSDLALRFSHCIMRSRRRPRTDFWQTWHKFSIILGKKKWNVKIRAHMFSHTSTIAFAM